MAIGALIARGRVHQAPNKLPSTTWSRICSSQLPTANNLNSGKTSAAKPPPDERTHHQLPPRTVVRWSGGTPTQHAYSELSPARSARAAREPDELVLLTIPPTHHFFCTYCSAAPPACESNSSDTRPVLRITKQAPEHTLFGGALFHPAHLAHARPESHLSRIDYPCYPCSSIPPFPISSTWLLANRPTTHPSQTTNYAFTTRVVLYSNHWNLS